jgi:hypothetical protein
MDLLSHGTRRALARWDGRTRQVAALLCAALAALLALTGGSDRRPDVASASTAGPAGPSDDLEPGYVAAVLPAGPASLIIAAGDRVDVYAALADLDGAAGRRLATAARVLSTSPTPQTRGGSTEATGYVVVELTEQAASALASVGGARLTLVVRARDG